LGVSTESMSPVYNIYINAPNCCVASIYPFRARSVTSEGEYLRLGTLPTHKSTQSAKIYYQ
jgi:hypothetical protein